MPDEASDQGQTIDDLILDILADEAQIIRCLRVFFCDTLQELSERYTHCPELKIRFAYNLITAAAKKEEALAKVLEAISLFEARQCPPGWLSPGDLYEITEILLLPLKSITVLWEDGGTNAFGTLYIDETQFDTVPIPTLPGTYTWTVNYPATEARTEWIEISNGCARIYGISAEYEQPDEWIPLAPGESYPLPTEPPEVSRITFEAKTDAGTTSQMTLFIEGEPFILEEIIEPTTIKDMDIGFTVPIETVSLTNTGSYPVYIRNLTTE